MAEKQNIPQNDEVDLGNLFKIIGKGFINLFNAIAGFFSWLFNLLVQLLIFCETICLALVEHDLQHILGDLAVDGLVGDQVKQLGQRACRHRAFLDAEAALC